MVGQNSLIITITRECNLRCSYCPTAKDGWPSLSKEAIDASIALFLSMYPEGQIKIFGGEPLLKPELVRYVLERVREEKRIKQVYVSTNGIGLNQEWIAFFGRYPKAIVTVSLDGSPNDHRRMRQAIKTDVIDSYDHVVSLLPDLLKIPRLVITQTIAPATAKNGFLNFRHLRDLGFYRFNFLPGYFIPWRKEQLVDLKQAFFDIANDIKADWQQGKNVYVRNLFVHAPTPFFNQGMIVDSDETIHPCNVGLSGSLERLRNETLVGTLEDPPTKEELEKKSMKMNQVIQAAVSEKIWQSTLLADQELTQFCDDLFPYFLRYKKEKRRMKQ